MWKNLMNKEHRGPHIDFGETSAIPEIHVRDDAPKVEQRKEEKEGKVHIIKEGVAVPEIMVDDEEEN